MKNMWILSVSIMLASQGAYAKCATNKTIFECTSKKGKVIEVCDNGKTIQYSFGKRDQPEILLNLPSNKVEIISHRGYDANLGEISIVNANTLYYISSVFSKESGEHTSGVDVSINNKKVATIECSEKYKSIDNINDFFNTH